MIKKMRCTFYFLSFPVCLGFLYPLLHPSFPLCGLSFSFPVFPPIDQHVLNIFFILSSGAYVTLYMRDCSYYEMRESKRHLSYGFPQAVHINSENTTQLLCSNNVKSQPNLDFYILLSDKNRRWHWLQATRREQQRLIFCTPRYLISFMQRK